MMPRKNLTQRRRYQEQAADDLVRLLRKHRRVLAVGSPASGKTRVAGLTILRLLKVRPKLRVLFVVDKIGLAKQGREQLIRWGLPKSKVGILTGRTKENEAAQFLVATVQVYRKGLRRTPKADLVVIDEAHHAAARGYRRLRDALPKAMFLGLTATPWRHDRKALSAVFSHIHEFARDYELIGRYIMEPEVWAPVNIRDEKALVRKLKAIPTVKGDYKIKPVREVMMTAKCAGNMTRSMKKHAPGKQRLIFATDRETADFYELRIKRSGETAAVLWHNEKNREQIEENFRAGKIQNLIVRDIPLEGWDFPELECVVIMRPTRSRRVWRQMCGRVMRMLEGKKRAIVLDHAANGVRLGLPTTPAPEPPRLDGKPLGKEPPRRPNVFFTKRCVNAKCKRSIRAEAKRCHWCDTLQPITMIERKEARAEMRRLEATNAALKLLEAEVRALAKERNMSKVATDAWWRRIRRGRHGAA